MDNYKTLRLTLILLLALTAVGCGNKGDLFLPTDPPVDQQTGEDVSEEDGEPEG